MKIAVIDSGVNGDREELKKYKIHHVSTELYRRDNKDNLGHGTAIIVAQLSRQKSKIFIMN